MKRVFQQHFRNGDLQRVKSALEAEAVGMHEEDIALNRRMGSFGAGLMGERVLTHCNAGALATAGYGTALGVIRAAVEQGKKIQVFADETRPFLAGSPAHRLGAAKGSDSGHSDHRQYGGLFHATGKD